MALFFSGLGAIASGCVVSARPGRAVIRPVVIVPQPAVVVTVGPPLEAGYQPLLYDGYVVYYTDDGVPFYWAGSGQVWVPAHARARYVTHYRTHRPAYHRWHRERGQTYRTRRYRSEQKPTRRPEKDAKPTLRPKQSQQDEGGKKTLKPKE